MSANGWTRADHVRLGTIAMQAGFATAEEAEPALMIGARMTAHGFTNVDIDRMIQVHYAEQAAPDRSRRRGGKVW